MCGIVGIYLKNKKYNSQLGKFLTGMMNSMATRGPDSAGFAIYSSEKKKKYKYSVCSNTDQVKEISKKLSRHVKDIKVKSISDHLIIETAMKPKKFIEILKLCYEKGVQANVQTASTGKPKSWFIKAFEANPNARWQFGIDGLPEESHKYRVNQDGQKLFDIMCEAKNYLNKTPRWQYIVFKYNEEHIEQAKFMAKEKGLHFVVMQSHRWRGDDDPYLPSKEYRLETL